MPGNTRDHVTEGAPADGADFFSKKRSIRFRGECGRVNPGAPQNLVGHPIADSREESLIQEEGLDRGAGVAREKRGDAFPGKAGLERLRRKIAPGSGTVVKENAPELAVVVEDERAFPLVEDEVVVFRRSTIGRGHRKPARHAKVELEVEIRGEREEEAFPVGARRAESPLNDCFPERRGTDVPEDAGARV